jgi:internalin A
MRYLMLILILGLFLLPATAQEDEQSPYEIALWLIEEVQVNGWTELDLADKGLTELPPEIGNLSNLETLWLDNNYLSSLPPEISKLGSLRELSLSNNQFTDFPIEVISIPNLQILGLGNNHLSSLPPEIGNLSNLLTLMLSDNQLSSLPPEIGNLSNLRTLMVSDNQLTFLPPEIGKLTNLCFLDLRNNQLKYLPTELGELRELPQGHNDCEIQFVWGISLHNNPLISPPAEVIAQGTPAILEYLRNEAWWHLQRLIAGGAGAIGIVASLILGIRWRNRRHHEKKKKG